MPLDVILWFVLIGLLLTVMGTVGPLLKKLWLSPSIVYLVVGYMIGPDILDLLSIDLADNAKLLEHLTEIAVIVSLFGAGMKVRAPLTDRHWIAPVILASATMLLTVAATTAIGHYAIGLSLGAAVLLGAVLAPTDPVLAAEVQLEDPDDEDGLRRTLTGEAGLNDGTAFPMVLLAVGLIDASSHSIGQYAMRWLAYDVVYKVAAGILFGYAAGWVLSHGMLWIRRRVRADTAADEMMTLGFISLVYGAALAIHSYAFLSVFTAALAMRRVEMNQNDQASASAAIDAAEEVDAEHEADAPEHAATMMTRDSLIVADTMERLVEIVLVVLVGVLLSHQDRIPPTAWAFAVAMVFVVRPAAVMATLWPAKLDRPQWFLVAWFGVRGIGTFYYLTHAINLLESPPEALQMVIDASLATVALSVVMHGVTVTPLMKWYETRR